MTIISRRVPIPIALVEQEMLTFRSKRVYPRILRSSCWWIYSILCNVLQIIVYLLYFLLWQLHFLIRLTSSEYSFVSSIFSCNTWRVDTFYGWSFGNFCCIFTNVIFAVQLLSIIIRLRYFLEEMWNSCLCTWPYSCRKYWNCVLRNRNTCAWP